MPTYICYNGKIHVASEKILTSTNRALKYGDGFFETMAMYHGKVPLLHLHWLRILETARLIGAIIPEHLTEHSLLKHIHNLAQINNLSEHARIRVHFFRSGEGLYKPVKNDLEFIIECTPIENTQFTCGQGLTASMITHLFKAHSSLSHIKSSSALFYVTAALHAQQTGVDECILTDGKGNLSESIYSNIILVKNEQMVTPDVQSGCVEGVLRRYLLQSLPANSIEVRTVNMHELYDADEVLLTNALRGVQWISKCGDTTYTNKKAVELTAFLNKNLIV